MKTRFNILHILVFLSVIFFSCQKPVEYPTIPAIDYKSFSLHDSLTLLDDTEKVGMLTFSLVDGDGDIGLQKSDTLPPYDTSSIYRNNFFATLYHKQKGQFVKIDLKVPPYFRIPYVEPQGQNKTLKADVEISLFFNNSYRIYDTIKLEFYIVDRALNQSNLTATPEIVLWK